MMNINKLKAKIVEKGLNVSKLADMMEVDRSTLYRKMQNGGESFTVKEVNSIVGLLELSPNEAVEIFFGDKVA
jgi:DNA-binding Xre family transcriptional regulator